ncbi:Os03g0783725, partial [Oryza sativa Japonica Group]
SVLVQNSVQDADLSPLLLGVRRVPLGKPHLALAADQEHEIDLQKTNNSKWQKVHPSQSQH